MKLIDKIHSRIDNTVKYVFNTKDGIVELSYIDKNDGKDIVCVPTQTSCNLGCKFCHLTGLNLPSKNISPQDILSMIWYVVQQEKSNKTLLVSYMGSGEPLMNIDGVVDSAKLVAAEFATLYAKIRFAVASIIPKEQLMQRFMANVKESGLDFKFHLSLHSTDQLNRLSLMPRSLGITSSINLLKEYSNNIGKTEIHYTLMDGVNDSVKNANDLATILKDINTTVKLLKFSSKESFNALPSNNEDEFYNHLIKCGLNVEVYSPPGRDIGSSCGQFNVAQYLSK